MANATRDRRGDPHADDTRIPWDERPIAGPWRGVPWWAAVLVGFGLAGLAAIIDIRTGDELGLLFKACYFIGCVAGIGAVRRRNLFAPMVQPPLIVGITVPIVVLFISGIPEGSDMLAKALAVGMPLIKGFPTMAITTIVVVAIGLVRLYRERDPKRATKPTRDGKSGSTTAARKAPDAAAPQRAREGGGTQPTARRGQAAERSTPGQSYPNRQSSPSSRPANRARDPRATGSRDDSKPAARKRRPETGEGGKPPQERQTRQGGKPPRERQREPGRKPPPDRDEGHRQQPRKPRSGTNERAPKPPGDEPAQRKRRQPEQPQQPERRAKQPPGKQPPGKQPPGKQPPPKSSPPPEQQRRAQQNPRRRQPPKRPWEEER